VRGAREKDMPVSVTGERRLPEGTTRREKDSEAFAEVTEVRDIGMVAENIFVNSVTLTTTTSNSSVEKFLIFRTIMLNFSFCVRFEIFVHMFC